MKLKEYNQKRDFKKTDEPAGKTAESKENLKFCVQHHIASRGHYDFRLESDGVLLSWAIPKGPSFNAADKRLAVRVEDHPLDYRSFEGMIPKGQYGGGTVMLWDEGEWQPSGNVFAGLLKGSLKFVLRGRRLKGKWTLVKAGKYLNKQDNWLLIKEKDGYSQSDTGISHYVTSVKTGRTMEEIEKGQDAKSNKNPFSETAVQLARTDTSFPAEYEAWVFELKYDGYRITAYAENGEVRLLSRNGNDYTKKFQAVADSVAHLSGGRGIVLDGEVVILNADGKTDFQALQNYVKNESSGNLVYIIFDLLALNGDDLRDSPLIKRKEKLEKLLKSAPENLQYSEHIAGDGKQILEAACSMGHEGIIAKRAGSVYSGSRNGDWLKFKCAARQEFVIGGYSLTEKKKEGLSAVLLGFFEGEELIYAGKAGTGFTEKSSKELREKLDKTAVSDCPFKETPKAGRNETVIWVKPQFIARISFAEQTKEGYLRHPSFKGLREEIEIASSHMSGGGRDVDITNPQKLLFKDPDVTKAEVAGYYRKAALRMLPHVKNRLLSFVNCPKGVNDPCFFKKHPTPGVKGINTFPVSNSKGTETDYVYITGPEGFLFQVQMNTLEFHIWGSAVPDIDKPDIMVFDLDPDEGMDLRRVREGVTDLKNVLDGLGVTSYLKTSGGKGYHIVVPFSPSADWEPFRAFSKSIAEFMGEKYPDKYTSNVRKASRKGRIFIDWIRNTRGATSVAPYSLRARKGAKVSMPIGWDELYETAPDGVGLHDAILRLGGKDPWADFFEIKEKQRLKP